MKAHLIGSIEWGDIASREAGSIMQLCSQVAVLGQTAPGCIGRARLGDGMLSVDLDRTKITNILSVATDCIAPKALSFCRLFGHRRRNFETRLLIEALETSRDEILIANIPREEKWRTALGNANDLATIAARRHHKEISCPDALLSSR